MVGIAYEASHAVRSVRSFAKRYVYVRCDVADGSAVMFWFVGVGSRSRTDETSNIVVFAVKFYLSVYGEVFYRSKSDFTEES